MITVVYNAHALLERTILSVISQSYINIEYIIIDGASSDGTLELAEQYQSQIALIQSGKDNGIYDAMNKGLKHATGDYVLFLNAGDEFYNTDTLKRIFENSRDADVYYGLTEVVNEKGERLGERRLQPPENLNWKSLRFGMCVSHQSFIARKSLCGPYDTTYEISADIDWVISVLKQSKKVVHTKICISKFLEGGTSNKRRIRALLERFEIMNKHYGYFMTLIYHLFILLRFPIHWLTRKSMT
ncbi:MAG: glycosyltransferase [Bacteroidota bacterium]|nr:glycosyltransferase [Bacteroidota bacterium]